MSDQPESGATLEPYFDRTPPSFADGLPDPLVYDASPRALRQRTVNFAAKHLVDMHYVSLLDLATAAAGRQWPLFEGGAEGLKQTDLRDRGTAPTSRQPVPFDPGKTFIRGSAKTIAPIIRTSPYGDEKRLAPSAVPAVHDDGSWFP